MKVKEFDNLCRGIVDYVIYHGDEIVEIITRDIFQDGNIYRENLVKLDKYEDAEIFDIYSLNDIIRVRAQKPTDSPV